MKFSFCIILFSIGYVTSSGYTCQGPIKLAPPNDLTQLVNWPSIWNDSMPPIPFASQQSCSWEISVPDGMYASVVFYKNAPSAVSISLVYPNGYAVGLDNNDLYPYILMSPKVKINLGKSKYEGSFSFNVLWSKYDPSITHDNIHLVKGATPTAMIPNSHLTTFTAQTTVSIVGFSLKNQSEYVFLRQSAVFDGESTSAPFLGTLYSIMMSGKEKVSSGKYLTVYTWGLDNQFDYTLYMVQDRANEQNFFTYRGVNCEDGFDCKFQILANYGTAVLVTSGSQAEYIKNIETFSDKSTLKVYEGAISDATLVTTLTKANYKNRLPMDLKNTIRQYVLDTETITGFTITHDTSSADWNEMYDGRKGFIHSAFHGVVSDQQDTDESFNTDKKKQLYFNYIVRDADFTGDKTSLTVKVWSNGNQVSSDVYNSTNLPLVTTKSVLGDMYEIIYSTQGASTKGFRIDFSTTSTVCKGEHLVPAPADITTTWYYPDTWRESDEPLRYAANQTCVWKINVPKGFFAFLTISAATNSTKLTVTDSVGNEDWVLPIVDQDPYFLLDPQFTVFLNSSEEGTFGMKVIWKRIGTLNPVSEQVLPNVVPTVKTSIDCDNGLIINSNTKVSLTSVRPPIYTPEVIMYMRNTVVFDGQSINDKLIKNLWQVYQSGNHIVSSGKYLTLYSFMPGIKSDSYAFIQDYQNVKQFGNYQGVSCFNPDLCPVILDARNGPGAAVRMSTSPHFLEEADLYNFSNMAVFTGIVDQSHKVAEYTNEHKLSVAQKFDGLFTTYVIDKAMGIIYLSNDNLDSNWTSIINGRTGIIASKNYGTLSKDQNTLETFTSPSKIVYDMSLVFKKWDLQGDATLTIISSAGGKVISSSTYNSTHLPPDVKFTFGDKLVIKYDSNGAETIGVLINFSFDLGQTTAIGSTSTDMPGGTTTTAKSLPIVPTTIVGINTGGTTQRFETTTKSGTNHSLFFPISLLFISMFL
ncbi:hypothetical protein GCK72_014463 [Caenorhabditis remanei]|uniref:CUB-like domain-containing protein n=1 Tax=Caenorhabditis remanei TaxID=31234 RepID=A0A6A5GU52_CAERE|nr:hypothetical protein GCK72_014463 [Caenorhabditis remanei]KAF1758005.1 hypothetical protein GCK72_014463 [Caenorhabditis remanei]